MSIEVVRRKGTTAEHSTFTGAEGEITIDTTKKTVVVHDGSTAGGFPLALEGEVGDPYVHPNHSGDVTSVADGAQTIANGAVTLAKMANMATDSFIGRTTAETGVPEILSKTDALTILNVEDGANAYSHPTGDGNLHVPATSTTNEGKVLTAGSTAGSLTWETPSGGGVTVEDNLTSTSTTSALSANQGKVLQDGKATKTLYTATLPYTSWTGSSAPYSKAVTVSGMLSTDTPVVDIVPTGTYATDVLMETNWSNIYRIVTSADTVTFYAHAVPTADIPLQILVVR